MISRLEPFTIDIFTLFPRMFDGPLGESILRRASDRDLVALRVHDLRDWATDRHRTADDTPYGGGAGMVMTAPLIVTAVESTLGPTLAVTPVIVLAAAGRRFTQDTAHDLSHQRGLVLICGHYEGIDERVTSTLNATPYSIGDYVLTGGELPAMVVIDAVCRLRSGVIDARSIEDESYTSGLLEYPQYTRPESFRERRVPDVLLSGHHQRITHWRRARSLERTANVRPDLLLLPPKTRKP